MKVAILHQNVCADRYDYKKTWPKRRAKFVVQLRTHRPDLVTLVECQAPAARWLAAQTSMKSVSFMGSSILYDPRVFQFNKIIATKRWLGGSQTHSLLVAEFRVVGTTRTINVGASHLPPFAWRAKLRKQQLATMKALAKRWHDQTLIGIDANWSKTFEDALVGAFHSVREIANLSRSYAHLNFKTSGKYARGNPIDYMLIRNGKGVPYSYDVLNGSAYSDHHAVLAEVEV